MPQADGLWTQVLSLGGYDLLLSQPLDRDELERVVASAARPCGISLGPERTLSPYRPHMA